MKQKLNTVYDFYAQTLQRPEAKEFNYHNCLKNCSPLDNPLKIDRPLCIVHINRYRWLLFIQCFVLFFWLLIFIHFITIRIHFFTQLDQYLCILRFSCYVSIISDKIVKAYTEG